MRPDGHQGALPRQVRVQLVLQRDERFIPRLRELDVPQHRRGEVRADLLRLLPHVRRLQLPTLRLGQPKFRHGVSAQEDVQVQCDALETQHVVPVGGDLDFELRRFFHAIAVDGSFGFGGVFVELEAVVEAQGVEFVLGIFSSQCLVEVGLVACDGRHGVGGGLRPGRRSGSEGVMEGCRMSCSEQEIFSGYAIEVESPLDLGLTELLQLFGSLGAVMPCSCLESRYSNVASSTDLRPRDGDVRFRHNGIANAHVSKEFWWRSDSFPQRCGASMWLASPSAPRGKESFGLILPIPLPRNTTQPNSNPPPTPQPQTSHTPHPASSPLLAEHSGEYSSSLPRKLVIADRKHSPGAA